jgi:hypothetical protein
MSNVHPKARMSNWGVLFLTIVVSFVLGQIINAFMPSEKPMSPSPNGHYKGATETSPETESSDQTPDVALTQWANGYTWNAASESAKRDLCSRLSSKSLNGVSAGLFYDAITECYNTTDANILNASLEFTCQYIEESNR